MTSVVDAVRVLWDNEAPGHRGAVAGERLEHGGRQRRLAQTLGGVGELHATVVVRWNWRRELAASEKGAPGFLQRKGAAWY